MFYKPRTTVNIKPEDIKISLVGRVAEVGEDYFVLNDGFGEKKISSSFKVEKDEIVRVFCSVSDEGLTADIVQSLDGLDLELFRKVENMFQVL